mmetsp:Transcript_11221/g.24263  ORF Transcript_11221/g.24263 Transcript_11221/m.24263 type:complete len:718 (-) Transcript_11221:44-2197(-)
MFTSSTSWHRGKLLILCALIVMQLYPCSVAFVHHGNSRSPHSLNSAAVALHSTVSSSSSSSSEQQKQTPTSSPDTTRSTETDDDLTIGPTLYNPIPPPDLPPHLAESVRSNKHPVESQSDLGRGQYLLEDWRRAWHTYETPADSDNPNLIDPYDGFAEYAIDEIDGTLPADLSGVLYRNGPGKFGVGGERVSHVLDGDGLIIQISIPPPPADKSQERKVTFRSRFVETKEFVEEREADKFLYRGTFGTGPRATFDEPPRKGVNEDPSEPSLLSRVAGSAFKTDIKNNANTQVISFGGKVLALFEAGLPYAVDPTTLETIGEDDMGGTLSVGKLPVKIGLDIPQEYIPENLGGAAHTAHPKMCPRTGRMVGWQWSQMMYGAEKGMEMTFTEWSSDGFESVASNTFTVAGCELAPHDMVLTESCILLKVNSLSMERTPFLLGLKGPAASLKMDGRAPVKVFVFPRPTASTQFEPYSVEVPACFSIHFSHGYEDSDTGNIVSFFSGWPPSDSKEFLGAWGGFCPNFADIPTTYIWRLEIDPSTKSFVSLDVAPGASNVCAEHPLVNPNFATRKASYVYAVASNIVGDASAPCGYAKLCVENGSQESLSPGEANTSVDAYFFGSRYFCGEPIIVPKTTCTADHLRANTNDNLDENDSSEKEAYLLGLVKDAIRDRSYLAIFDLERNLSEGPVCKLWLKTAIPHGLHGCFAEDETASRSVFC